MRRIGRISRNSTLLLSLCGTLAAACAHGGARTSGDAISAGVQQQLEVVMRQAAEAWNRGDIDAFLAPYKDDALTAFMAPQITYGIPDIRARYLRSYFKDGKPKAQLTYDDLKYRALGSGHVLMTGRWHLVDDTGKAQDGYYTLVWERTEAGWKIIHDHSS